MGDKFDEMTATQLKGCAMLMMHALGVSNFGESVGMSLLDFSENFCAQWRKQEAQEIKDIEGNVIKKSRLWNMTLVTVTEQDKNGIQVEKYRCTLWRGVAFDRSDSDLGYALENKMWRSLIVATLRASECAPQAIDITSSLFK